MCLGNVLKVPNSRLLPSTAPYYLQGAKNTNMTFNRFLLEVYCTVSWGKVEKYDILHIGRF